jgi:hypothetical protein
MCRHVVKVVFTSKDMVQFNVGWIYSMIYSFNETVHCVELW